MDAEEGADVPGALFCASVFDMFFLVLCFIENNFVILNSFVK